MKKERYRFELGRDGHGRLVRLGGHYRAPVLEVGRRYLLKSPRSDGTGWVTGRLCRLEGNVASFDELLGSPWLFAVSSSSVAVLDFQLRLPNGLGLLDGYTFIESGGL